MRNLDGDNREGRSRGTGGCTRGKRVISAGDAGKIWEDLGNRFTRDTLITGAGGRRLLLERDDWHQGEGRYCWLYV